MTGERAIVITSDYAGGFVVCFGAVDSLDVEADRVEKVPRENCTFKAGARIGRAIARYLCDDERTIDGRYDDPPTKPNPSADVAIVVQPRHGRLRAKRHARRGR